MQFFWFIRHARLAVRTNGAINQTHVYIVMIVCLVWSCSNLQEPQKRWNQASAVNNSPGPSNVGRQTSQMVRWLSGTHTAGECVCLGQSCCASRTAMNYDFECVCVPTRNSICLPSLKSKFIWFPSWATLRVEILNVNNATCLDGVCESVCALSRSYFRLVCLDDELWINQQQQQQQNFQTDFFLFLRDSSSCWVMWQLPLPNPTSGHQRLKNSEVSSRGKVLPNGWKKETRGAGLRKRSLESLWAPPGCR